jgi:precorrin-2 methylase
MSNALFKLRALARLSKSKVHTGIKTVSSFPAHNKIGLGLGVTSLGLSVANYQNNMHQKALNESKATVETKSLQALQKIHTALVHMPTPGNALKVPE